MKILVILYLMILFILLMSLLGIGLFLLPLPTVGFVAFLFLLNGIGQSVEDALDYLTEENRK